MAHDQIPIYDSKKFTTYSPRRLAEQLGGWVDQGIPRVKMKIGSSPDDDPERVTLAREAIGPAAELFVDANGAYSRKQALELADRFRTEAQVSWFEEPLFSIVMGPPLLAPGSLALVGGLGLAAAAFGRER